jgi:hypothetical protein
MNSYVWEFSKSQCSIVIKIQTEWTLESGKPIIKSQFHHLLAMQPWAQSYLHSLNLRFPAL